MSASAHVRVVLDRLSGVRPTSDGWDAHCPCPNHNKDGDQHASLRVGLGDGGRILIVCRVGCQTDAVLDALGLDWADLFPADGAAPSDDVGPAAVNSPPDADRCDAAYGLLLEQLKLEDGHRADLRQRGLTDAEIDLRQYRSLRNNSRGSAARAVHDPLGDDVLTVPGFVKGPYGVTLAGESTGLLVPVRELAGRVTALKVRRAADPKYVYLTSANGPSPGSPVHVPLGVSGPAETVRVTEGELKADVCTALDATPTIGVPGVTQWRAALPVLKALGTNRVVLAYDAPDVRTKSPVLEQAELFFNELARSGFMVDMEDWE